jgi:Outer membrane protein beta-barrel domain
MYKLLSLILLFFVIQVQAQSDSTSKKFGVGLRGALAYNFTNFSGAPSQTEDYLSYKNGAIFFEYRVSNLFSIQPEIQYSNMGVKEYQDSAKKQGYTMDVNYIGLAVLPKLRLSAPGEKFGLTILAGPAVNYFLDSKISMNGTVLNLNSAQLNGLFDKFNITAIVGLGTTYRVTDRIELLGEFRANASIRNAYETLRINNQPLLLNQFTLNLGAIYSF